MNWKFIWLTAILFITPYQISRAEVVVHPHSGPTCRLDHAGIGYCLLHLNIRGEITGSDVDELKRLIDQAHQEAESKKWEFSPPLVELDSPGGSVPAAMAIGRLLRKEYATAQMRPFTVCYSSCILIFAGAVRRILMPQSKVGIHRPYLDVPEEVVSPDKVRGILEKSLNEIRAYFREMNVSEQLADAMLRINPEDIRILNDVSLRSYGLTPQDPIAKEIDELKEAQTRGLTREEYMRRKTLAQARCGNDFSNSCYQSIMKTGQAPTRPPRQDELTPDFSMYGR
jgi:hypothetical protein